MPTSTQRECKQTYVMSLYWLIAGTRLALALPAISSSKPAALRVMTELAVSPAAAHTCFLCAHRHVAVSHGHVASCVYFATGTAPAQLDAL